MSYGVTPEGFQRKRLEDILSELQEAFRAIFGASVNLTASSVLGQIMATFADREAALWELAESVYNSMDPNQAEGAALDAVAALVDVRREAAQHTTVTATLTGDAATVVPAGSRARVTGTDIEFELSEPAVIGGGGTVDAEFFAVDSGPIPCSAGTLTEIATPISGWASVTNASDGTEGQDEETDVELRARRLLAMASSSGGTVEAVGAYLLDTIEEIESVTVIENDTDAVDGDGRPPHSFEAIVYPDDPDPDEIAEAIWTAKPAGIATFGSESAVVTDSYGINHTIYWSFASGVSAYLLIQCQVNADFDLGDEQIETLEVTAANDGEEYAVTIAGRRFAVTAGAGSTPNSIAAQLTVAINDVEFSPMIANMPNPDGKVILTHNFKGNVVTCALDPAEARMTLTVDQAASGDQAEIRAAVLARLAEILTIGGPLYPSQLVGTVHEENQNVLLVSSLASDNLGLPWTPTAAAITPAADEYVEVDEEWILVWCAT